LAEPRAPAWTPPSTLEERIKRLLVPARLELARVAAREMRRGEPEVKLLPALVDPRRAAIDAGANRGVWSYLLSPLTPKVFAFEPNPKLFAVLKAGARANVECLACALSDRDGGGELLVPGAGARFSNQGATLNPAKVEGIAHVALTVETRRLDSLDLPPIGFIKIDVEGHEMAVVRGARALIARDKPRLVIEMEERHTKAPLADALGEVASLGYRMLYLGADGLTDGARFTPDAPPSGPRGAPVNNFIFIPL
jgi:FkbM family methyltransferase